MTNKLLSLILFLLVIPASSQEIVKKSAFLMGSDFEVTVVAKNKIDGEKAITLAINEITRIENLISSWKSDSETSLINRFAGVKPITVSKELFDLIDRSLKISKLTDGAFDISYASMDKVWQYDGSMTQMPSEESIKWFNTVVCFVAKKCPLSYLL